MKIQEQSPDHNLYQDSLNPESKKKQVGLELATSSESDSLQEKLSDLDSAINHDKPITDNDMKVIEGALSSVNISVGGDMMSISEIESIPNFKRNMEIFKEILDGNLNHSRELTFITSKIAESLSKHKGYLVLSGLTTLSDNAAESLSKHKGNLYLNGLTSLSDNAAESLSKHKGYLGLSGLTTLSDSVAESLSKHEGYLGLDSLTSLSDNAAESFSKHKGILVLNGLTSLSDNAAESLSRHSRLYVSKNLRVRIDKFKK